MTTAAIRDKLYDYIRIADDKKIKAIYTMLEEEIEEKLEWWKDNSLVKELDAEYTQWKKGKMKGYSMQEVDESLKMASAKRKKK